MESNVVVGNAVQRSGAQRPSARLSRRARRSAVPLVSSLAGTVAAGVLGTLLAGCSALSPAVIATPYAAADGVDSSLSDAADGSTVKLRNMLIVTGAEGGRGQLIGTLTNTGQAPVQVQMVLTAAAEAGTPTRIAVPANGAVQLGAGNARVVLDGVPAAGSMAGLTVTTQGGGTADLTVPVMAAQGFYATLTPPPASATPTP